MVREYDPNFLGRYATYEFWQILPATLADIYNHCPPDQTPLVIGSAVQQLYQHKHDPRLRSFHPRFSDLDTLAPASAKSALEEEFGTKAMPSRSYSGLYVITVTPEKLLQLNKEWGHHVPTLQILVTPPDLAPLEFFRQIALPGESIYGQIQSDGTVQLIDQPTTASTLFRSETVSPNPLFLAKSIIRHSLTDLSPKPTESGIAKLSDQLHAQISWATLTPDQQNCLTDFMNKDFASHFHEHTTEKGGSLLRKGSFKLMVEAVLANLTLPDTHRLIFLYHIYEEVTDFLRHCQTQTPKTLHLLQTIYHGHSTQITPAELVEGMVYLARNYSGLDFSDPTLIPEPNSFLPSFNDLAVGRPSEFRADHVVWELPWPSHLPSSIS